MKPVLVAQDEAIMMEPLRDWLADSGYQIETAKKREEALTAELGSWDKEGKVIAEQVINRFPVLFPYFSKG